MANPKPVVYEPLISALRAAGVPESELQEHAARLFQAPAADCEHFCTSCGRASGTSMFQVEVHGEVVYSSPSQWVYCYRERGIPLGLCDQCFRHGRFDGFTPDEIAYFQERFERLEEPSDFA